MRWAWVAALALCSLAACAPAPSTLGGPGAGTLADRRGDAEAVALHVSAASSLTDAFADIATAYEARYPDVEVILNLAGSAALREQILAGAPADVFAAAGAAPMERLQEAGVLAEAPRVFAQGRLAIAVPAGNPGGVSGLADFARPRLLVGLCAEGVPCGDRAREALAQAGVRPAVDTNEPHVRALLAKVAAGELDAGITYRTDLAAAQGAVEGIEIPADVNAGTVYLIAVLAASSQPDEARRFVDFVLSAEGRALLAARGFEAP